MAEMTFGPVETVSVSDLASDDFVVMVPPQRGVRGVKVNSGIRDMREDHGTWTRSGGYRQRRIPMASRVLMFKDPHAAALNLPATFIVEARRLVRSA